MRLPDHLRPVPGHEACEYQPVHLDGKPKGFFDRAHLRYQLGGRNYGTFAWGGDFALSVDEWDIVVDLGCRYVDFVEVESGRVYRIDVAASRADGYHAQTPNGPRWITRRRHVLRYSQPSLFDEGIG